MKRGYANVFIFACGQCNYPVVVCTLTPNALTQEECAGEHIPATCPFCSAERQYLGCDAAGFQSVEWNLEIRSQFRKPSI
jgi:hypothetical protein